VYSTFTNYCVVAGCSLAVDVVGRMASDWNYAILTPAATDEFLGDKDDFRTLTRLTYNFQQLGRFYTNIFEKFNWTDVTVMLDMMGTRRSPYVVLNILVGENVHAGLTKAGLTSTLLKFESDSEQNYVQLLNKARATSRGESKLHDREKWNNYQLVGCTAGKI
jgi:hypothetical protein